jgi:hypothetical protein
MKRSLTAILLLIVIFGCDFPMEEVNHVEISDIPKNQITIALADLPDTVEIIPNMTIFYDLQVEGYPAIAVFIVVGEYVEYLGYNYSGGFTFRNVVNQLPSIKGYLPFEFIVFTTTRTGSMADRSQRELMIFSEKRILHYDQTPVKSVNFTKVEERDGSLFLHWNTYPEENLFSLSLQKTLFKNGDLKNEYIELDKNATSYQDNDYIGTEVEYVLITNTPYSYATGEPVRMNKAPSKIISFEPTGPNQVKLKWTRPTFYSNSVGYSINQNDPFGSPLFSNSNESDTTFTLSNLIFGDELDIFLTAKSRKVSNNTITKAKVWAGVKKPSFKTVAYDRHDGYLFLSPSHLIKDKDGVRDSIQLDFDETKPICISSDGNSIFVPGASGISEISTSDLASVHSYPVTGSFISLLPVANTIITIHHPSGSYPLIKVYDKTSGILVQTFNLTDTPGGQSDKYLTHLTSTHDPNFILGGNDGSGHIAVFKLASNGTIESAKFVPGGSAIMTPDGSHVYVFDGQRRSTYTFPQLIYVDGSDVPAPGYAADFIYDTDKRLIGIYQWDRITIIDMDTLTPLKTIKVTYQAEKKDFFLKNGVLLVDHPYGAYSVEVFP